MILILVILLPGWSCNDAGFFDNMPDYANWWSSSEHNSDLAWSRFLYFGNSRVGRYKDSKNNGFSVRCLRD